MVVDFHTHFLPRAFPALPAGIDEPAWPRMEPLDDGRARMFIGAREFRVFDDIYWNPARRIESMERLGVDVQVMSPLPEVLSYWLDPRAGRILTDATNAHAAEMVAQAPRRLRALGVVALQDVDVAVRQVEEIGHVHRLSGIFVGSNVNGVSIADRRFDPFFAAAAACDLPVFVHGIRPAGLDRMLGSPLMGAALGIPHENTMAVASLMMTDVLGRFPGLKLVFSHGGGGLGAVLDRMTLIWERFPAMRETLKVPPVEYARRFYFDTAVFGAGYLRYLIGCLGADCLVAGTDGPTEIGQTDLVGFLTEAGAQPDHLRRIIGGNASRLLGLASPTT